MTDRPRILALFGSAALLGQERGNIEALAALKDQGCHVLCVVRDEAWSTQIPSALEARGLELVKAPYIEHRLPGRMRFILFRNPVAFVRANWRLFRVAREFRPTHIHAFNQLYVLNFAIALMLIRLPMIFRAGDEPTVHNWMWRACWRFVVWRTHFFVANSRFVKTALCSQGVDAERVAIIYNKPPQRPRASASPPPSFAEMDGDQNVTFVGQISAHKGVHILIEAFRAVALTWPSAQLVIAGRISDWSGDAWARHIRSETLNDPVLAERVRFLGEVENVRDLLSRSTVHVVPSIFNDPSPNVVMEAKQAGCPSIVFPRGGMPELVQDGVDGLVCREATPADLADSLRRYLDDAGLARLHGQAALASLAAFGMDQFAQRWMELYLGAGKHGPNDCAKIEANGHIR